MALESSFNNLDAALDFLQKLRDEGRYDEVLSGLVGPSTSQPSTSSSPADAECNINKAKELLHSKIAEEEAFQRFREGYNNDDDEHLDLPLTQEETLILEYKGALNM